MASNAGNKRREELLLFFFSSRPLAAEGAPETSLQKGASLLTKEPRRDAYGDITDRGPVVKRTDVTLQAEPDCKDARIGNEL